MDEVDVEVVDVVVETGRSRLLSGGSEESVVTAEMDMGLGPPGSAPLSGLRPADEIEDEDPDPRPGPWFLGFGPGLGSQANRGRTWVFVPEGEPFRSDHCPTSNTGSYPLGMSPMSGLL